MTIPDGWREWIAVFAMLFHFPPSELWAMSGDDIRFWALAADNLLQKN
jgi:hypothetical protein